MASTGLHKNDSLPRVERPAAPARLRQWVTANARRLAADGALAAVRQGDEVRLLARWPEAQPATPDLIDTVTRSLGSGARVERTGDTVLVCVPIRLAGRPGAIGFSLRPSPDDSDEALVKRVHDTVLRRVDDAPTAPQPAATTAPLPLKSGHTDAPSEETTALVDRQGAALELIAAIVDHDDLDRATRALVDALATRFACTRVTLGTRRLKDVTLNAVSGTADFDPRSAAMVSIARALRETVELSRAINVPGASTTSPPPPEHLALSDYVKAKALLSLPLVDEGKASGAVLLERDRPFSDVDVEQITQLLVLSAPVFRLKQRDASGPMDRLARSAQHQAARWFGADHLVAKSVVALALLVAGWSSVHHETLSVTADASIEASVQRAVVAGANSYISQVEKRAGDVVYQGDVLARLDVEDLQLERLKWESERDKLAREQRATLAQRDRTRVRVLSAQRAQAQAQIEFLDAQIARAVLRAPIDGVVVAGDLSEALGSPVERGQLLFEVASLRDYRLVLTVDESDIGDIGEGYRGRLKLRSLPNDTFEFVVTRITPVSDSGNGRNAFRLEANLQGTPDALRPGMDGIAKIEAGEHPIGVIWTRAFVRWARLQLWRLGLL